MFIHRYPQRLLRARSLPPQPFQTGKVYQQPSHSAQPFHKAKDGMDEKMVETAYPFLRYKSHVIAAVIYVSTALTSSL